MANTPPIFTIPSGLVPEATTVASDDTLLMSVGGITKRVTRANALTTFVDTAISDALTDGGVVRLVDTAGTAQAATANTPDSVGTVTLGAGFKALYTPDATNTATEPTLAVNGGTAYPIRLNGDSVTSIGSLIAGRSYILRLSGASPNYRWHMVNYDISQHRFTSFSDFTSWIAAGGDAPDGTVVNVAGVQFEAQSGATDITGAGGWVPFGPLRLGHFGDNATPGTTDMTTACRELHTYANTNGLTVSYEGAGDVLVDADAQIVVNTSVDFGGANFKARNGILGTISLENLVTMFIVQDSGTPLVESTSAVTAGNMTNGSTDYTKDFFTEVGYVFLQGVDGLQIPNRARDAKSVDSDRIGIATWTQREGQALYPLTFDWDSVTSVSYKTREMPAGGRISLRNMSVDTSTFNNQVILLIERNNVEVDGFQAVDDAGTTPITDTFSRLIRVEDAGMITVTNVAGTGQEDAGNGGGTYLFSAVGAANINLSEVNGVNGWGATGCKWVTGFRVKNSNLSRVDCHAGAGYMDVQDCTLNEFGVAYGWGWGHIRVTNPTLIGCPAVYSRTDQGGYFFGDIIVDNPVVYSNAFKYVCVDLATNAIGVAGFELPCPNIIINNLVRGRGDANATTSAIEPITIAVASTATDESGFVTVPSNTTVDGVSGFRFRLEMSLAFYDMKILHSTHKPKVNVRNVRASHTGGTGIYIPAATVASPSAGAVEFYLSDIENLYVDMRDYTTAAYVDVNNCSTVGLEGVTGQRFTVRDTRFLDPHLTGGDTVSVVGGAEAGNEGLQIYNSEVLEGPWSFTHAEVLTGVIWDDGLATAPVLPAGATRATAATGWFGARYVT